MKISSLFVKAGLCAAFGVFLCAGPVPSTKPDAYPKWWFERDVIVANPIPPEQTGGPVWPGDYAAADDYAAANIGQLKNIAAKAAAEFNSRIPGGAGAPIQGMVGGWGGSTADDYAAINVGQLKAVASKFYDRLDEFEYAGDPVADGRTYPWLNSTALADDYALANLGQLKYVFSFDLASDFNHVIVKLAAGEDHSLALRSDGSVWAWGKNDYGQLGLGSYAPYFYPTKVAGLSAVRAVAGGAYHSVAAKQDGTVWAWGYNGYGQLGDGTTDQRLAPVQVPGLSGVVAVAAGDYHSLALKSDGTVWGWGDNGSGRLGDGTDTPRLTPVQAQGLGNVVAIAANSDYSLALKSDGTVWAWGSNSYGRLGTGDSNTYRTPIRAGTLANIVAIVAGDYHAMALDASGRVWAWGYNGYGQLGDTTTNSRSYAAQVSALPAGQYVSIAAGNYHSAAVRASDGAVFTWGQNDSGQLGLGTVDGNAHSTPVQVPGLTGQSIVAAGGRHTLAAYPQGALKGFGYNSHGQVGNGTNVNQSSPATVQGLTFANKLQLPVFSPDGGAYLSAPTVTVGSLDAGVTLHYTINGAEPTTASPTIASGSTISAPSGFLKVKAVKAGRPDSDTKTALYRLGDQVAAGEDHSLALRSDGSVWAWGKNDYGQLGLGSYAPYFYPTKVAGLSAVRAVAGGAYHSVAAKQDGTVWAWGYNGYGQLGDGTTDQRLAPVQVPGLSGVVAVAAGDYHSLALKSDGTVWGWGDNGSGRLGDGTDTPRLTPVQAQGLGNVVAIAANSDYSLALKSDGTVWAWGSNSYGRLGTGDSNTYRTPIRAGTLANIVAIVAGDYHAMALDASGRVWAWGYNGYGQLGDTTTNSRSYAAQVSALPAGQYVSIAAGNYHSAAVRASDGAVFTWGQNDSGQLGLGTVDGNAHSTPVQVPGLSGQFKAIAAGGRHTVATYLSGTMLTFQAWGANNYGQVGNRTNTSPATQPGFIGFNGFDTDADGLADDVEIIFGLQPLVNDRSASLLPAQVNVLTHTPLEP